MWAKNEEYIKHVLTFAGVPFEEPLNLSTLFNTVFLPNFKEAILEVQKQINFSFMRNEIDITLPAGSSSVRLNTPHVKFIQAIFPRGSKFPLEGFDYAKYTGSLVTGNPSAFYYDDNNMTIYFNKIPMEDITYRVILYRYDLDSDPHPILQEAPEILKYLYLSKIFLQLGEHDKYEASYAKFIALSQREQALEKVKKARSTILKVYHGYEGWW